MAADLASAAVYTDFQGLARLRSEAGRQSPEALRDAARQFEALFLQMMLKSMRDAVPRDEDGPTASDGVRFFEGMYDQQMSLHLSQGGGLGLADVIARQLGGQPAAGQQGEGRDLTVPVRPLRHRIDAATAAASGREPVSVNDIVSLRTNGKMAAHAAHAADRTFAPETPEEFVRGVWSHAERAAARLGVDPEVLIAQAALETGWGRHVMRRPDGSSSHNYFGIKADSRWRGDQVRVSTLEYVDGVAERQQASFRSYQDPGRSFDDYADFIMNNPRYREALDKNDSPEGYLREIHKAGYATDPKYADKILSIMNRGATGNLFAELKLASARPIT